MRRYSRSLAYLARARAVTPGGAQTMSKAATAYVEGAYPTFMVKGEGCRVQDVDGSWSLDWICGLGAVTLGHAHPVVNGAIRRQLENGVSFPVPHVAELTLAERLIKLIPCAEMVRFIKTGSEACEAAVRIARAATNRSFIASSGYHGWPSLWAAPRPVHPGVPKQYGEMIGEFRYNDLASLDQMIFDEREFGDNIAAIILEPALFEPPAPGFLEGVRERASKIGAILIFDEVVMGFRWALAGGQEYFGVTPDLATFGKGMANGLPLACVVGRRDLMEEHGKLISGTHGGEALSLAACHATLDVYEQKDVIAHLWDIGRRFQDGFNVLAQKAQAAWPSFLFRMSGYPVKPKIVADISGDREWNRLILSLFLQECAERGVLFHPGGLNICFAHREADVDETLEACAAAFQVVLEVLDDGTVYGRLRGKPYTEAFRSNEPDR